MTRITTLLSRLIDAFVAGVAPLFGRFASGARLVAVEETDGLAFYSVAKGKVTPAGKAGDEDAKRLRRAGGGAVELRLSPARILTRTVSLPAAGRDYLEPIIEHRLERLTPWRPEKVLFGFSVSDEPGPDGAMDIEVSATSADLVAPSLARLEAAGLAPTALGSAAEPLERPLSIDLYRGRRDAGRRRLRRAVIAALAVTFAVLVPGLAGSFVANHFAEQRLAELDHRLVTKRNVLRTMAGNGEAQGRDQQLIEMKREETAVMILIDRVAELLPDDTVLSELAVEGTKIRMVGLSGNAPALIGPLEADPAFSDVRFSAPVTRTEDGRDSFDLVAVWDGLAPENDPVQAAAPGASEELLP